MDESYVQILENKKKKTVNLSQNQGNTLKYHDKSELLRGSKITFVCPFCRFVQPYVLDTIESMKKDERAIKLGSDFHRMERDATFLESLLAMHTNTELEVISELLNDLLLGAIDTVSHFKVCMKKES